MLNNRITVVRLLQLQKAGGIMDSYPNIPVGKSWEQFVVETFDTTDQNMVELLSVWKVHLDTKAKLFNLVIKLSEQAPTSLNQ